MGIVNIENIQRYTVCLYREKFAEPVPTGTGILLCLDEKYYLVSAHHIFDMEEEQIQIESDPDEEGISHDDLDGVLAKSGNTYFFINHFMRGQVFTAYYDEISKQPVFNEDTEWCVCELTQEMVEYFRKAGKDFFNIDSIGFPYINPKTSIIISGFPRYVYEQTGRIEEHRSYLSEMIECNTLTESSLIRVYFENDNAYNCEQSATVRIPKPYGIEGMSGGGLWYNNHEKFIPIGIILKQDPKENFVEAYRLDSILRDYLKAPKEESKLKQ